MATIRRLLHNRMNDVRFTFYDSAPLAILLLIGITGLTAWQSEYEPSLLRGVDPATGRGIFYATHMLFIYVLVAIFPATKFFHFFVRLLSLSLVVYRSSSQTGAMKGCRECGLELASTQQVADLAKVVADVQTDTLNLCPSCKRKLRLRELLKPLLQAAHRRETAL